MTAACNNGAGDSAATTVMNPIAGFNALRTIKRCLEKHDTSISLASGVLA